MTTEFNELLPDRAGDEVQIWIIGHREQVTQTINEFCVRRVVSDRAKFTPLVPTPFADGKFMTVLVR